MGLRSTFTALRARSLGHRIARQVLHPWIQLPPIEQPRAQWDPIEVEYLHGNPDVEVLVEYHRTWVALSPVLGLILAAAFAGILWLLTR